MTLTKLKLITGMTTTAIALDVGCTRMCLYNNTSDLTKSSTMVRKGIARLLENMIQSVELARDLELVGLSEALYVIKSR